ncbi:hypothetical protein ACFL5E_02065 [Candidatus Omnitrophota bacterium]
MMMKRLMVVLCVVAFICAGQAQAQPVVQSGGYTTAFEDEDLVEDIDKKLDTTIKVLNVIKEELEEYKKSEAKAVPQQVGDADVNWAVRVAKAVVRTVKAWRKVQEVVEPEIDRVKAEEDDAEMTRDISDKLDQTIKAMSAIKEELDKMEEADKPGRK